MRGGDGAEHNHHSLEERLHITPVPVRDSLHRENLQPRVTHADPNIIVLIRTKSRGKFAPGMSGLEVIRRISWLQLTMRQAWFDASYGPLDSKDGDNGGISGCFAWLW